MSHPAEESDFTDYHDQFTRGVAEKEKIRFNHSDYSNISQQ